MGTVSNTKNFGNIPARQLPVADTGSAKAQNKGFGSLASRMLSNGGNQANGSQQHFGLNLGVPAAPVNSRPGGNQPMPQPSTTATDFAALNPFGKLLNKPSQSAAPKAEGKPAAAAPQAAKASETALGRDASVNAVSDQEEQSAG